MKLICGDICDVVIFERAALTAESTEPQGDALRGGFMAGALAKPGTEPKWNVIFPRGTWHGPNFARMGGSFTVDDGFMSEVVSNWNASGKPRIPVRWGHEHMKAGATPELKRALDRKAGNVVDLRITAAGLEGLTDWNPEGAADVSNGTFDGWSAEWWPKHVNRLTGETRGWYLSGVALTNEPYFELLPRIAASLVESTTSPQHAKGNTMNEEQLKLRASLGLAPTATDAEVLTAQTKQATELAALKASTAEKSDAAVITAAVEPVQKQVAALTAALAEEKRTGLERDVKALIATATRGDGKMGRAITEPLIARAQKIAASEGLKASEEFLLALPLSVPVAPAGVQGTSEQPLTAAAASVQLATEVEKLTKEGNISPWLSAIARHPELAQTAQEGK